MLFHKRLSIAFNVGLLVAFILLFKLGVAEVEQKEEKADSGYKVETIGHSVQGKPIRATIWNENKGKPVLVMCAMHGDEKYAAQLGARLDEEWRKHPEVLEGMYVIIIPAVNPDGLEKQTRCNGNGVDLNRNFPLNWKPSKPINDNYGGKKPLSEPESQALAALLQKRTPSGIISIHNRRVVEGEPLIIYDGSPTALSVANAMKKHNNYKITRGIGYPVPGSFFRYARRTYNVVFNTVEMPDEEDFDNVLWPANSKAILAGLLIRRR